MLFRRPLFWGAKMSGIIRVAVLLLVWVSAPASAQQYSLVGGTWIHSEDVQDYIHPGSIIHTTKIAQFTRDGRLIVRDGVAGPYASGETATVWRYQLTSGSSYTETLIDYSPKRVCGAGICGPIMPPPIPMGTRAECNFEFENQYFVQIACPGSGVIRYSRH